MGTRGHNLTFTDSESKNKFLNYQKKTIILYNSKIYLASPFFYSNSDSTNKALFTFNKIIKLSEEKILYDTLNNTKVINIFIC
jgi:hypothetical protein